jgi:poly(hydroxyalkanoate) depolymerase family esterase
MALFSKIDMAEATRLTRLGRLGEAMALLRGRPKRADSDASVTGDTVDLQPPAGPGQPWTATPDATVSAPAAHFRESNGPELGPASDSTRRADGKGKRRAPPGARFEDVTFRNAAGKRTYKLYVPSGYHGQPAPLVVMLHGCTQTPEDFAAGTRMNALAEEQLVLVAYPAQARSANASGCWNWFNPGDQQRDHGEPSLIAGITRQVIADYAIDGSRVYIAGLSAGGATAAIMGSAYPDLFAAVGVHSGLACGAAKDMPSAFAAMKGGARPATRRGDRALVPTIVFHGDKDRTVSPINGEQVIAQSKGDARLRVIESQGMSEHGVRYRRTVHANEQNVPVLERWEVHGAAHAWFGGSASGSYTDPKGPDASREMVRFFLQHRLARG